MKVEGVEDTEKAVIRTRMTQILMATLMLPIMFLTKRTAVRRKTLLFLNTQLFPRQLSRNQYLQRLRSGSHS